LGVFAGGLAHDFNNMLTVVLGNLALARAVTESGSEADNLMQSAGRACEQAAGLTRQLLTFSRGGAPVTRSVALGAVIEGSLGLLLQDARVSARTDLPGDLWQVEADAGQIHQVISNIVLNAFEAMPLGGLVDVAAVNVRLVAGDVPPLAEGEYVHVTIADHGEGIAPSDLDRIFEPYFTTKPHGHGLGLATCWSIVRRHGGHITADSVQGEGAAFHVYLPRAKDAALAAPARPGGFVRPRRVLLMDDEREILSVTGEMLRRMGHQVTLARDGDEAVAACRDAVAAGMPIEVAVLDLTIPGGMGGREACGRLRELDRRIGVVASSGYSNDAVMGDFRRFGFQAVLPKPYRIDELQAAIEAAAQSAGEAAPPDGQEHDREALPAPRPTPSGARG
jgi:CheY-like chemotaxis protein